MVPRVAVVTIRALIRTSSVAEDGARQFVPELLETAGRPSPAPLPARLHGHRMILSSGAARVRVRTFRI